MATVLLTRHGERIDYVDPDWLSKSGHNRRDDPHLAPKGLQQARELAERLSGVAPPLKAIYSSPFVRAVETAHIIAEVLSLEVCVEPGICEVLTRCFPPEFLATSTLCESFPLISKTYVPVVPPNELGPESSDASSSLLRLIISQASLSCPRPHQPPPGSVLFVGHGASCAGITEALCGRWSYMGLCTLSTFVKRGGTGSPFTMLGKGGDAAHLSDPTNLRAY
ncbi:unnamed protein product [Chrysoparadoxa australica]